jgi:hypothetical protein
MIAIALLNQLGLSGVRGCLVSQVEIGEFSDFLGANFVRLMLSSLGGEGSNVRWWAAVAAAPETSQSFTSLNSPVGLHVKLKIFPQGGGGGGEETVQAVLSLFHSPTAIMYRSTAYRIKQPNPLL